MPLSGIGLCEALSITPRSASSEAVRKATPGVGTTPRRSTSPPAQPRPATTSAPRLCPARRVPRPTTAPGRCPEHSPRPARRTDTPPNSSHVRSAAYSPLPRPTTQYVPNRCFAMKVSPGSRGEVRGQVGAEMQEGGPVPGRLPTIAVPVTRRAGSALGELGRLPGLLQTSLLALDDAGVTGEQSGLLQRRAVGLDVDGVEGTGHAEAKRTGLASDAAAVDAGDDVEATLELEVRERLVDNLLVQLVREVVVQLAAVDGPVAGAGDEAHSRDGLLATAGGVRRGDGGRLEGRVSGRSGLRAVGDALFVGLEGLFDLGGVFVLAHVDFLVCNHWEICVISNGVACWAACGCSGPE